jgi:hypothetical protein
MDLESMRSELSAQHAELRRMIEAVRESASEEPAARSGPDLRSRLDELSRSMREHNRREEELLGDVLPTIDAWGSVRRDIMTEQHVSEHGELAAALDDVGPLSEDNECRALLSTLDRVLEHMAREEKAFLSDPLLREDAIAAGQVSG